VTGAAARHQLHCCHKKLNVLDKLPQRLRGAAESLREIYTAPTGCGSRGPCPDPRTAIWKRSPQAVVSLTDHQAELLTYCRLPRGEWESLRTSNLVGPTV